MAWEHKLLHEHDLQEVIKGTRAVVDYLREQIEDRKKNPRDDLISYGIEIQKDGRSLSENELLGFCFNLFIGGLDRSEEHTSELQSLMRSSYAVFCLKNTSTS